MVFLTFIDCCSSDNLSEQENFEQLCKFCDGVSLHFSYSFELFARAIVLGSCIDSSKCRAAYYYLKERLGTTSNSC